MKEFEGKVAIVTGAASGIGYALAERFASEGMKVVLSDIEESALLKTEKDFEEKGYEVTSLVVDVSKESDIRQLAENTIRKYGAIHILCNNAGVFCEFAPIWKQSVETWNWMLGVNLWGVIHGIRTFVPIMIEQGTECHIINTASMSGLFSMPMISLYNSIKHAVISITESLYMELKLENAKIGVSVLCPGMVKTNFNNSERNRPDDLRSAEIEKTDIQQIWHDAYSEYLAGGMDAAAVADITLDAIKHENFYIFPSKPPIEIARSWMNNILSEKNPELNLPEEMLERLRLKITDR